MTYSTSEIQLPLVSITVVLIMLHLNLMLCLHFLFNTYLDFPILESLDSSATRICHELDHSSTICVACSRQKESCSTEPQYMFRSSVSCLHTTLWSCSKSGRPAVHKSNRMEIELHLAERRWLHFSWLVKRLHIRSTARDICICPITSMKYGIIQ